MVRAVTAGSGILVGKSRRRRAGYLLSEERRTNYQEGRQEGIGRGQKVLKRCQDENCAVRSSCRSGHLAAAGAVVVVVIPTATPMAALPLAFIPKRIVRRRHELDILGRLRENQVRVSRASKKDSHPQAGWLNFRDADATLMNPYPDCLRLQVELLAEDTSYKT